MFKDLIEYMAKSLVNNPDEVRIEETEDAKGSILELHVAQEDLGKVIGKNGRTAKSMRAILSAASTRAGKQSLLKIVE
ncbi:MAG: KH domain-containing protein [Proteobacteria bacterium]|nr:KH domain-containing protein [Pseudomonadota bacterium]